MFKHGLTILQQIPKCLSNDVQGVDKRSLAWNCQKFTRYKVLNVLFEKHFGAYVHKNDFFFVLMDIAVGHDFFKSFSHDTKNIYYYIEQVFPSFKIENPMGNIYRCLLSNLYKNLRNLFSTWTIPADN